MTNLKAFKSNDKFKKLSPDVARIVEKLDNVLSDKGYLYRGIWRDDRESGGNVFIFEVEQRKGRRKNLITLRPQISFLKVEVYWNQYDKHYFDIYDPDDIPDDLLKKVSQIYNMISL